MKIDNTNLNKKFDINEPMHISPHGAQKIEIEEFDELDILLDLPEVKNENNVPALAENLTQDDFNKDLNHSRNVIYTMIKRSQQLVDIALAKAADEDSGPRDIEVAGNVIDKVLNSTTKLIELQKHIEPAQIVTPTTNIQNNFYTTEDIIKQLRGNND